MATSSSVNLLITGTPGVGKSSVASKVAKRLKLEHINISELAKENNFILEYDAERECRIIDERKIVKHLKKKITSGGLLIEYHSCDFFPSKWFDNVYVLRTDSDELYRRLSKRDYPEEKIKENVECEIFQTILEEAQEKFDSKVIELQNNNHEQLQYNVRLMVENVKNIEKK